jgi:hypothetical protein
MMFDNIVDIELLHFVHVLLEVSVVLIGIELVVVVKDEVLVDEDVE